MPPWHAGSGGRDSRSRQIKEDPRIGPFLQQWKTREKNRDRSENLPDSQKDSKIDRKTQTQRPLFSLLTYDLRVSRNARTSFESRFITPAAERVGAGGGAGAHSAGEPLAMMSVGAQ